MVDPKDLMTYENQLREKGYRYICGVDEVGRGPLAGPVTCTAVIMDLDDLIVGVNDSKKVSKGKREKLFDVILSKAVAVSTVSYPPEKIDEMNIRKHSFRGCFTLAPCAKCVPQTGSGLFPPFRNASARACGPPKPESGTYVARKPAHR